MSGDLNGGLFFFWHHEVIPLERLLAFHENPAGAVSAM